MKGIVFLGFVEEKLEMSTFVIRLINNTTNYYKQDIRI